MNKYRVLYGRELVDYGWELVDDLTDLWIAADPTGNRILQELTFVIDRTLARDAEEVGESRSADGLEREGSSAAFNGNVRVRFDVFPTQREVEVTLIALMPFTDSSDSPQSQS